MLGSSLAPHLSSAGHNVIRHSRSHGYDIRFNLSDHLAWEACISQLRPDTIVNLVVATNVDQCERNPHVEILLTELIKPNQVIVLSAETTV